MIPLPIFLDHWADTIIPEKKTTKQTNKHASVISLLAKIRNSIFFQI
jgi:hypothetical protein